VRGISKDGMGRGRLPVPIASRRARWIGSRVAPQDEGRMCAPRIESFASAVHVVLVEDLCKRERVLRDAA